MRYYAIKILDPATGEILVPNINNRPGFSRVVYDGTQSTYTSLKAGASPATQAGTNANSQRVDLDLPVTYAHDPAGNANPRVVVWGIGIQEISQASNLNGLTIEVYGGFARGLPLANFYQAGLLVRGQVLQAYGNWINTDQNLSIYLSPLSSPSSNQYTGHPATASTIPLPATNATPANIVFQWLAGQPLLQPLVQCLQVAFPTYTIQGAVSPNLVWSGAPATGYWAKLQQFSTWLNQSTLSMLAGYAPLANLGSVPAYGGVAISVLGQTITVQDGTVQTPPVQLQFKDLIGQPNWSQPYTIQVTCPMRADIQVGYFLTLPPGTLGTISQGSASEYFNPNGNIPTGQFASAKSASIFTGTFQVSNIRHVGSSRNPDAVEWITVIDLNYCVAASSTVSAYPTLATATKSAS